MSFGLAFWIIMLIWLLFSIPQTTLGTRWPWGGSIVLFVLLGLLGWHAFGAPIHG